ncbi:uncharacterized protein LOC123546483 [Mercenaria mercenaria]|uniref:uncharacterized protein LOC123546483 n=1 Tax=Mercenaria mercenaria TaxID=6596 RepID=UPI00234F1536|nr:uncharacterized protein LOC123546483 [Mercenaria mercenaria]
MAENFPDGELNLKLTGSSKDRSSERGSERSSKNSKGSSAPNKKVTVSAKIDDRPSSGMSSAVVETGDRMLSILQEIQNSIKEQDNKLMTVTSRLDGLERSYDYEGDEDYFDYPPFSGDMCRQDENENQSVASAGGSKRKSESRFSSMAKHFKRQEVCDESIDDTLAENVHDLFRNGIEEERYSELVKDEINCRPENCESLVVVKTNPCIWDGISQNNSYQYDKKLQNIETSVVKAGTILAKAVNKMAVLEQEHEKYGELIENCNDVLALLGHSNKQINMFRRDLMKPEIKSEYSHLCNHSLPFTKELFGDDISKTTKEIEDCAKISNKIRGGFRGRPSFRGSYRGRFPTRNFSRGRGLFHAQADTKNYPRRRGTGKVRM